MVPWGWGGGITLSFATNRDRCRFGTVLFGNRLRLIVSIVCESKGSVASKKTPTSALLRYSVPWPLQCRIILPTIPEASPRPVPALDRWTRCSVAAGVAKSRTSNTCIQEQNTSMNNSPTSPGWRVSVFHFFPHMQNHKKV